MAQPRQNHPNRLQKQFPKRDCVRPIPEHRDWPDERSHRVAPPSGGANLTLAAALRMMNVGEVQRRVTSIVKIAGENATQAINRLMIVCLPSLDWQKEDAAEYFTDLMETWLRERGPTSRTTRMVMHPAYQQIIGMGPQALPFIFRELEQRPNHWFWALRAITGTDPVPDEVRGNIPEMASHWLKWAKEHGFIW